MYPLSRHPAPFLDATGQLKPILQFLMDNSHGPPEALMQFVMGLVWRALNFDLVGGCALYGGGSKGQVVEMTNGTFAGCINGMPFNLPDSFEDEAPKEQVKMLADTLHLVTGLIDAVPFNREYLHVQNDEGSPCWAAEGPTGFRLDEAEIRSLHA
jgi:hypothetical protein